MPTDIFLDALPFPFPALVFMFPKSTIRHAVHGECRIASRKAHSNARAKFHICAGIVMKFRALMPTLLIGFGYWE
jgi:hypothetical protein